LLVFGLEVKAAGSVGVMEFDEAGARGNAAEAGLGAVYILKPYQCLRHEISLRCPAIKEPFRPTADEARWVRTIRRSRANQRPSFRSAVRQQGMIRRF
jgi:hypothetical protein